jgi:hypothetical protein
MSVSTRLTTAKLVGSAAAAVCLTLLTTGGAGAAIPAKDYANCTALNKDYPHGVGKRGAHDKTSSTPVKNFTRNNKVYRLNDESDRDKDGIACEKR